MNFIKRMIDRAVTNYMDRKHRNEEVIRSIETFEGKTTVQRIANGYVVCGSNSITYCTDHVAIADFIVAQATRNKMGVGTQMDMFDAIKLQKNAMFINAHNGPTTNATPTQQK